MKKILLFLCISLTGTFTVSANTITFINLLNVTFKFGLSGSNPGTGPGVWYAEEVVIPPGNTIFTDPTLVPNVSASALPGGTFLTLDGVCDVSFLVADPSLGGPPNYPTVHNFPTGNSCNNSIAFQISWQVSNGNALVLIF